MFIGIDRRGVYRVIEIYRRGVYRDRQDGCLQGYTGGVFTGIDRRSVYRDRQEGCLLG